jgi:hypothetical protein
MVEAQQPTDATLTEYLPATDNARDMIDGAAKITLVQDGRGIWVDDDGESLDNVAEYGVECSCGETFDTWGAATRHAEEQH